MGCGGSKAAPAKADDKKKKEEEEKKKKEEEAKKKEEVKDKSKSKGSEDDDEEDDDELLDDLPPPKFNKGARSSVSAEAYGKWNQKKEFTPPVIAKDDATKERIRKALNRSFIFSGVDNPKDREVIVDAFEEKKFKAGETIIKQGDDVTPEEPGLYMLEEGECAAYKNDIKVYTYKDAGGSFGELALLYNAPRAASVKAETDCLLWSINRDTFNATVKDAAAKKRDRYRLFLKSVATFDKLDDFDIDKISDAIKAESYKKDDKIITEGEMGKTFYILEEGSAEALKEGVGKVKEYAPSDYFGELAILKEQARAATVVCTTDCRVLSLEKDAFERLLGSLEDMKAKAEEMYNTKI